MTSAIRLCLTIMTIMLYAIVLYYLTFGEQFIISDLTLHLNLVEVISVIVFSVKYFSHTNDEGDDQYLRYSNDSRS